MTAVVSPVRINLVDPKNTIQARLNWVLKNRKTTAIGTKMNADQWSLAAGKVRQQVTTMLNDPKRKDAKGSTYAALAWAAKVSLSWLQSGSGDANDPDVPPMPELKPRKRKQDRPKTFGDLSGWMRAEPKARRDSGLDAAIRGAREREVPLNWRPKKITSEAIVNLARVFLDSASDEERDQAERLESADRLNPSTDRPSGTLPLAPKRER